MTGTCKVPVFCRDKISATCSTKKEKRKTVKVRQIIPQIKYNVKEKDDLNQILIDFKPKHDAPLI